MKRLIPFFTFFSFACANSLVADEPPKEKLNMELYGGYNYVDRAKCTESSSQKNHHITFSEGFVLANYEHTLPSKTELQLGVGYMDTMFSFSHHHKSTSFDQKHINNLLVQLGATTMEEEKWKLDGGLGLQINTDHFSLSRYTFFSGIIHGKYDYAERTNLHVGIECFTGMRYTRVLPLIGFDYTFSDKLKLNAVFPVDMSLVYSLTDHVSLDATIRYMLSRQRLNNHGDNNRRLVAYRNWGAEGGITYAVNSRCKLNLHVGETFGARMRLSDRNDKHRKHLKLNSSLYYGLEASFAF